MTKREYITAPTDDPKFNRRALTHGRSRSRVYAIWGDMLRRVRCPATRCFQNYGGRGITVCGRWYKFENFLADMGDPPSDKHTIDRIDSDGNYEPQNCRWATWKEQRRNTRNTVMVGYQGQQRPLAEWCEILGIPAKRTANRLVRGWTVQQAFELPLCKKGATSSPIAHGRGKPKRLYI